VPARLVRSHNELRARECYFTIADGMHDLGALVDGGLTHNDWDDLAVIVGANGRGQILGQGKLTLQSGGQIAFLLTPAVPESSAVMLMIPAAAGWCIRRRR
jgi:hypothetical protein